MIAANLLYPHAIETLGDLTPLCRRLLVPDFTAYGASKIQNVTRTLPEARQFLDNPEQSEVAYPYGVDWCFDFVGLVDGDSCRGGVGWVAGRPGSLVAKNRRQVWFLHFNLAPDRCVYLRWRLATAAPRSFLRPPPTLRIRARLQACQ